MVGEGMSFLKVYFILCHKKPAQVQRLINLLDDHKSLFFIHLDKKINEKDFKIIPNAIFIKNRVECTWGKFSLVEATMNGFEEIIGYMDIHFPQAKYHCILLSGEDLPLKSNNFIHEFLFLNRELSFIDFWELPNNRWWGGGMFRLNNLYLFSYKNKFGNMWLNRILKKLKLHNFLPINRLKKAFPDLKLYGNSQWLILNKDLLKQLSKYYMSNPSVNKLFKNILAPDEIYFSTIIRNFLHDTPICSKSLHLIKFDDLQPSPSYLSKEEIKHSEKSFHLFARKFDDERNWSSIKFVIKKGNRG